MPWSLETFNKGVVGDFGFVWGNTSQVALGELPSMPHHQFCEYSKPAIQEIFGFADKDSQKTILKVLSDTQTFVSRLKIRPEDLVPPSYRKVEGFTSEILLVDEKTEQLGPKVIPSNIPAQLRAEMVMAISDEIDEVRRGLIHESYSKAFGESMGIKSAQVYPTNPFKVSADRLSIEDTYEIAHQQFIHLAIQMYRGGMMGWDKDLGVPKFVRQTVDQLVSDLNSL